MEQATTRVGVFQCSMQFGDTAKQHEHDAEAVFSFARERRDAFGFGTEAGPGSGNLWDALLAAGERHGYRLFKPERPTDAWLAVDESRIVDGTWQTGYDPIIPGSNVTNDPHRYGPKGLVRARYTDTILGPVSLGSFHSLTDARRPGAEQNDKPGDPVDHYGENRRLASHIRDWAAAETAAGRLVFVGGDANQVDRTNDIFFSDGRMVTSWDSLRKWPNTGHGNIDVLAFYENPRIEWVSGRAYPDSEFMLHTDHFLIRAVANVALPTEPQPEPQPSLIPSIRASLRKQIENDRLTNPARAARCQAALDALKKKKA